MSDDSVKGEKATKLKHITFNDKNDGLTKMLAQKTDVAYSKKPGLAAKQTFDSMCKQLEEYVVRAHSGTSDYLNEGKEIKLVLRMIDKLASEIYIRNPEMLTYAYINLPDLIMIFDHAFREFMHCPCQAHNHEGLLGPILNALAGPAGLKYDLSTAQCNL